MTRSSQIKKVYAVLRETATEGVPAGELLRCAAEIVRLSSEDDAANDSHFEVWTGGVPFEDQTLSAAFADGGWRILNRSYCGSDELLPDDSQEDLACAAFARWVNEVRP